MALKYNVFTGTFDYVGSGGTGAVDSVNGFTGSVVLTTANVNDATDKRYLTEAERTKLTNTSGTNSGDNATNTQYSGLAASKQDTLVSGTNIKTINSTSLLGSGDIVISGSGAVDSVNSQTGVVVLDADDISDTSTTKKFTTASDISKLAGIAAGAEVNVNADWNAGSGDAQILNKPSLSTVATTGSYTDLSNKPTLDDITAGTTNKHFTATEQTKLSGIATSANNYTHPNHSGDVTSSGDGATTIANDAVTNAKLANVATATIKGRITSGSGDPEDLTASDVRSIINVADGATANVGTVTSVGVSGTNGIEVASSPVTGSGTIALSVNAGTLRSHLNVADGANNYVHPNHSGDVTSTGDGATTIANLAVATGKIANQAVTYAKIQNVGTGTFLGRTAAGTGSVTALTSADTFVSTATTSVAGRVQLATDSEVTTASATNRAITPNALRTSIYGRRSFFIQVSNPNSVPIVAQDSLATLFIPADINNWDLIAVSAQCTVASSSGLPTVQIRNVTDSVNMLSTALTIDANEKTSHTAATPAVINTSVDDVQTGDQIEINVTNSGTGTKGLHVVLTFQKP